MRLSVLIAISSMLLAQPPDSQNPTPFVFTNSYQEQITAVYLWASAYNDAGRQIGRYVRIYDSLVNRSADPPIAPGVSATIALGAPPNAQVAAVMFSDGTTSGDPRAIGIIEGQRKLLAGMLPRVIQTLAQFQDDNDLASLTAELNTIERTTRASIKDRQIAAIPRLLIGDAIDNLNAADPAQPGQLNRVIRRLIDEYTRWLSSLA